MPVIIGLIVTVIVIGGSLSLIAKAYYFIYNFLVYDCAPIWFFCLEYKLLLGGAACFLVSLVFWLHFRPHKAEKYLEQYRRGLISRQKAVEKIGDSIFVKYKREKIPSAYESKRLEKRIKCLNKRIQAETSLLKDIITYIRTKERAGL